MECGIALAPGEGLAFKDDDVWRPVCKGIECVKRSCPEHLSDYRQIMALEKESKKEPDQKAIERARKAGAYDYQIEGVSWLTSQDNCLLGDECGLGKAEYVENRVFTPFGRRRIGDIKVGDQVIGSNGKAINVLGVFPQGQKDLYRITFNDGYSLLVCKEHLFTVSSINYGQNKCRNTKLITLSVEQMLDKNLTLIRYGNGRNNSKKYKFKTYYKTPKGNSKWQIPTVNPIHFTNKEKLLIEPYFLGCLLGDGGLTGNTPYLYSKDIEIINEIKNKSPSVNIKHLGNIKYSIRTSGTQWATNLITESLKKLKLMKANSEIKFIPEMYKYSSIENRISILQGLMDTDGHCMKSENGNFVGTEFCTVSERLADDVAEIVHSLGGIVRKKEKIGSYKKEDGTKVVCKKAYRLNIKFSNDINPFRLTRKANKYNQPKKYKTARYIKDIRLEKKGEAVCIQVDADDHLYATEYAIITHNTNQLLMSIPQDKGALAVVPTHLKLNWRDEAKKWRPDLDVIVLKDGKEFHYPEPGQLVIISYGLIPWWLDLPEGKRKNPMIEPEEREIMNNTVLLFDEVHALKNNKAIKTKRARELVKMAHKTIGATGTPILNRELELWNICRSIGIEKKIFESFPRFLYYFRGRKGQYGYTFMGPRKETPSILRRAMLRREKKDVNIELPDKIYIEIPVDVKGKSRKVLDNAWDLYKESDNFEQEELPDFTEFSKAKEELAASKIAYLKDVIKDFEDQDILPIVFSAHQKPVDTFKSKKGWKVIKGGATPEQKHKISEDFQKGKLKGLAATIKSAGTGLTLTKSKHVIFNDLDFVPANNLQAEYRVARIGQEENKVFIYHLVADHPLDRHIRKLILKKMALADAALNEDKLEVSAPSEEETEKDYQERVEKVKENEKNLVQEAIVSRMKCWKPRIKKMTDETGLSLSKLQKKSREELAELGVAENDIRILKLLEYVRRC